MEVKMNEKKRELVKRTFTIFKDQQIWLANSTFNQTKLIRELLDDFISKKHEKEIEQLKLEISQLKDVIIAMEEK